jgi:hypothetical protein
MAWKNLKQLSLADSLTSEHEALTELDDINELMDWEAIEHPYQRNKCASLDLNNLLLAQSITLLPTCCLAASKLAIVLVNILSVYWADVSF